MVKKDSLDIRKYPNIYRRYLEKEIDLTIKFVKNSKEVLDIGCGTARIVPFIADKVKGYVGIDIDKNYLKVATELSEKYNNVKIMEQDVHTLSNIFKPMSFDKTISLWHTVACFKDDRKAIEEISTITRNEFFFSAVVKGTLEVRKKWYENFGIKYTIDEKTETIFSPEWGLSRAYSKEDIAKLVQNTGFEIKKMKLVENLAYAIYLKKE